MLFRSKAKTDIAVYEKKQAEYEHARHRFESRSKRLDRVDDRFNKIKTLSPDQGPVEEDRQSYIQAAVKRMKQKKNTKKD